MCAMSESLGVPGSPKSLPLILARELAANLATPMFLLDQGGMMVFYNDAAAMLLGKSFAELGEIPSGEFGAALQLATRDGEPVLRRESPAGVAFFQVNDNPPDAPAAVRSKTSKLDSF